MSVVIPSRRLLSARTFTRFLTRSQSTATNGPLVSKTIEKQPEAEKPIGDEVLSLRQRQFNDQIVEQLKALSETPLDEIDKLGVDVNGTLTEREKQLDEELTDFLRKYSQLNRLINTEENSEGEAQRSFQAPRHRIRGTRIWFLLLGINHILHKNSSCVR